MNTRTTHTGMRSASWMSLCAALIAVGSASAQNQRSYSAYPQQPQYSQPPSNYQQPAPGYGYAPQGYGYTQQPQRQYENPIEFLPKFGKRMSEVVRRIFYGQDPTGWDNPPQGYGANGGYSLEAAPRQQATPNYTQQPPPGYSPQQPGYQYPQQQGQAQPRYNYPPQQTHPSSKTPQPSAKAPTKSGSSSSHGKSSSRTYSPPKLSDSPPSSKNSSKTPPTTSPPKEPVTESPPPPTTTTRRSESAPPKEQPSTASSGASGSFLKGKRTTKPGRVISPYPPYKELDVTGLDSGSLALDPTTQKVFEVP